MSSGPFLPQNEDPSVTRSEVEARLKETIGTAKENGSLYTTNWDSVPLPQALVKADRDAHSLRVVLPRLRTSSPNPCSTSTRRRESLPNLPTVTRLRHRGALLTLRSLGDRISYSSPDKRLTTEDSTDQTQ